MRKNYVNMIVLQAMFSFMDDIKAHPTYGWRICNYAGECDYVPDRQDVYTDLYDCTGYSFAHAVMIAANNKTCQPNNDIWVEPDDTYRREKEEELCKWILNNNVKRKDYTTLENMSAGRANLPDGGGMTNRIYDEEYKSWIINQL